jgi:tRNA(Ile)-lysidine synthase
MEAIDGLVMGKKPQARICLPYGLVVKRAYDELVFVLEGCVARRGLRYCYSLSGPGTYFLDAVKRTISIEEIGIHDISDVGASNSVAFLNADAVTYPLVVRNFRPGDRFIPFGMNGHKKLKDFFIDLKIPSETREKIPILTCGDMLVWICGLRIDDRFKVTNDTKRVLRARLI